MLISGKPYRSGRRGPEPYNQYNLVDMLINGKPMHGRPIEFDSEPTTADCKNMFGAYIKPTKLSTTCPDCGAGLTVAVKLPDPPFPKVSHTCEHCHPEIVQDDPFVNPVQTGRIAEHDLDPLLYDGSKVNDGLTVAERMKSPGIPLPSKTISVPYVAMPDKPVVFDPKEETDIENFRKNLVEPLHIPDDFFTPAKPDSDVETLPGAQDLEAEEAPPTQEEAQEVDLNDILSSEPPALSELKETQGRAIETADGISPEEDDSDLEDDS